MLLIGRTDVRKLLPPRECLEAVEEALRAHGQGESLAPASLAVAAAEGAFHVKAAGLRLDGQVFFAAKLNGNFPLNPARRGLPTIQGLVALCDASDGVPLALMDSMEITALRTAAATAVAARRLAGPRRSTAAIVGCGVQGEAQAVALAEVLPLQRLRLCDLDAGRARALGERLARELRIEVETVGDPVQAASGSDVVVTCTTSRRPLLGPGHVAPGGFVAAVGADSPEKQELDPELLAASAVVVDLLEPCARQGELHHALERGLMRREDVRAELAEVVCGRKTGRRSPEEVVVFDSTGNALLDVAAAARVYRNARAAGWTRSFAPGD